MSFNSEYMILCDFHMIVICVYMLFIWFYMIFIWFYMILYDFHMILYGFHMILGCLPKFSDDPFFLNFERSTGNSNVRPEMPTTTEIFEWPAFFDSQRLAGFWTFDQKFESSARISNVGVIMLPMWVLYCYIATHVCYVAIRPEIRTFDRKFGRSTGNSN